MDPDITNCEDGDARLVGGPTALEGRVEVCLNNVWGTVCQRWFHRVEVQVVCNQFTQAGPGTFHAIACYNVLIYGVNCHHHIQIHLQFITVTMAHQTK